MRRLRLSLFVVLCFFSLQAAFVSLAYATDINMTTGAGAVPIDWQKNTGSVLYSWGTLPDERIPADNHSIKNMIKNLVDPSICGTGDKDYSKISVYAADITGRNLPGYILDESKYFARGMANGCPFRACDYSRKNLDRNGNTWVPCRLSLYLFNAPTQVIPKVKKTPETPCPLAPSANSECRRECPADPNVCPALFFYNIGSPIFMPKFVYKWALMTVSEYADLTKTVRDKRGGRLYMDPSKLNPSAPVLVLDKAFDPVCSKEEVDQWIDNSFPENQKHRCIKFYQYGESGFVDLYGAW